MKISAKTMIGCSILLYLKKNGTCQSKDLIDYLDVSKPYFEQCVGYLVKAGIVLTERGCKGGYYLREGSVNLWEVITAYGNSGWDMTGDNLDLFIAGVIEVAKNHNVV